jgi:hypothetical protein
VLPASSTPRGSPSRALLIRVWRESRLRRGQITVWFYLPCLIIMVLSIGALSQSPRDLDTNSVVVFSISAPWQSLREVDPRFATLLNFIGIRTYADLRELNMAERPDGWDGKDWSKVKRLDLRGATRRGAILVEAQLQGADLYDDDADSGANRQGADLSRAQLQSASPRAPNLKAPTLARPSSREPRSQVPSSWARGFGTLSSRAPTSHTLSSRAPTSPRPSCKAPIFMGLGLKAPTARRPSFRVLTSG